MNKKLLSALVGLFIVASSVLALNGLVGSSSAKTIDDTPDCDTVAIIKCGAFTQPNLRAAAAKGDVPKVFSALGVSQSELGGMVNGVVWKDGTVTVGDTVVATGAMTAGRWNNPTSDMTSIPGTTRAHKMSTSHFVTDGQTAFVKMVDGQFKFAVIKACGNPVKATPKTQPPKPTPVFTCDTLTPTKVSRAEFRFDTKASASGGAKVTKYTYDFGDGETESIATTSGSLSSTINHTYDTPGTYTVKVTVWVLVDGKTVIAKGDCETSVTAEQPPTTPPPTPNPTYQCDSLTANLIDNARHTYSYTLTFTAKDGATFQDADFDFGDGTVQNGVTEEDLANVQHSYTGTGPFTTTATLHFDVDDEVQSDTCKVTITIPAVLSGTTPPPPTPEAPQELPSTGPIDYAVSGLGLSSVAGATYYWRASRRNLISKLLNH